MKKPITKKQLLQRQQEGAQVKLIDIRSSAEYEKEHVPGTINIAAEDLANQTSGYLKNEVIVCICNHGHDRSQSAAEMLYLSGFQHTHYLEGGTSGWFKEV